MAKMKIFILVLLVTIATFCEAQFNTIEESIVDGPLVSIPEDGRLNFTELAQKYGHEAEEFYVITEDGYNLTIFHLPGDKSRPVMLTHGFGDSADTFIIRGNTSLAIYLVEAGYDVWVTNYRGNKYSRRHVTLSPNDKKFWDYSFHEIGYYDMKANIDFVLNYTGQTQLQAIGHSEGTTVYYILAILRPEYNDKTKLFISLAPICYLDHVKSPIKYIINFTYVVNDLLIATGNEEILGNSSQIKFLEDVFCTNKIVGYPICAEGIYQFITGFDSEEIEPSFFEVIAAHYPSGTSRKNLAHFGQVGKRKKFAQYDYGAVENLAVYGSTNPPEYNLTNIRMRTALFVARNDKLSTLADVERFRSRLRKGTVVEYRVLPRKEMSHIDFTWGKHMYQYLFPYIFKALEKYN